MEGFACNPWTDSSRPKRQRRIYYLFGLINYSLLIWTTCAETVGVRNQLLDNKYDFVLIAQLPMAVAVISLILVFVSNSSDLYEINVMIKDMVKFSFDYSPEVSSREIGRSWHHSEFCLRIQMIILVTLLLISGMIPFYDYFRCYPNVNYGQFHLIFGTVTFGLDKAVHFWLIYFIQLIPCGCICITLAVANAIVPVLSTLVQGQIVILTNSLLQIPLNASDIDLTNGLDPDSTSLDGHNEEPRKPVKQETKPHKVQLKDCIIHHQLIYRLSKKIKSVLAPFLFINVFSIILCLTNLAIAAASDTKTYKHPKLMIASDLFALLLEFNLVAAYIVNLREAYPQVGLAAYSIYRDEPSHGRSILTIISRANSEEKFPCIISSSFTFHIVRQIVELSWNYFVLCDSLVARQKMIDTVSNQNTKLSKN